MLTKAMLLFFILTAFTACAVPPAISTSTSAEPTAIVISTLASPIVASVLSTPFARPLSTATSRPVYDPTQRPKNTSTPTDTPPTPTSTIAPTSVSVVAAPPGLVYSDGKGQWQVAANGRPALIITGTNLLPSPNGQMAIKAPDCCNCVCDAGYQLVDLKTGKSRNLPFDYLEAEWAADNRYIYYTTKRDRDKLSDIWRWDVVTGENRNLTHTPDRDEWWLSIWPQRSDTLVFYSTEGFVDGAGYVGYLTIMRTDGSSYQIVSHRDVSSPAAFSPDGQTITYAVYEETDPSPWYYRVGAQPQRFPWKNLG